MDAVRLAIRGREILVEAASVPLKAFRLFGGPECTCRDLRLQVIEKP
jgi:hypothetical protein